MKTQHQAVPLVSFLLLLNLVTLGCQQKKDILEEKASEAVESVGCPVFKSSLYDVVYESLIQTEVSPTVDEIEAAFAKALEASPRHFSDEEKEKTLVQIKDFYKKLEQQTSLNSSSETLLEKATQLEVRDQVSLKTTDVNCGTGETTPTTTTLPPSSEEPPSTTLPPVDEPAPTTTLPPSEGGGDTLPQPEANTLQKTIRRTVATAYQTCDVMARDPLNASSQELQGVAFTGYHSDGVGRKRVVGNLAQVQATHPYIKNVLYDTSKCFSVKDSPLIYDYGGKPYTTTAVDSALDFFKNAGSGTSVLGVDCSGFVFSVIARAGLKISPTGTMKSSLVHGIPARFYLKPESNGLSCFAATSMGVAGSLKAGDIVAIGGHVIIIDSVASDPLSILRSSESSCNAITYKDFKFVIAQSSPSKGSVGINFHDAADYLKDSTTMKNGFEKVAREACKARLKNSNYKYSGTDFQIVRHKGTSECMNNKVIPLAREACVSSCFK